MNIDDLTAYHERPTLTVNGVYHSKSVWMPTDVKAGDEVDLECEGVVGKPPVPMVWEIMNMMKDGSYRRLTENDGAIGEGTHYLVTELPFDNTIILFTVSALVDFNIFLD